MLASVEEKKIVVLDDPEAAAKVIQEAPQTAIDLATSRSRFAEEAMELAERLLILEDIEEEQADPGWPALNRRLVELIGDAHLRLGLATWADAAEQIGPDVTMHPAWIKWRRTALESILNPTQVQLSPAPLHEPPTCPVEPATANTECARRAYRDAAWVARATGKWAVIYAGEVAEKLYDTHDDAMLAAMDAHKMLGNFVCMYVARTYCDYKMRIYEAQEAFAQDIRDL